ncbi:MAG TPA: protein kinase [Thermoanaerobaculia bacterium]|nr:protein kinase [Thermoanaerobaculia bacterium]
MVGTTLSHYQILREIGGGAMGRIFLARDVRLGRSVAIKMLPPALVADPVRRQRFERESKALATLNHPNVVTIHSVEEVEGQPFLVMEWIEGRSLEELIPPGGMELPRYLEIAIPMVEAVSQAHLAGIVHRDLKPANVMVRDDGVLKVVDFGISTIEPETLVEGQSDAARQRLTQVGVVVGTLPYMSPEQLEGIWIDARSDIFSLGVILYEMATGYRPFQGGSSASLLSSILRDEPVPPTRSRASLPASLDRIVARCLQKRPQERYQTAAELKKDLQDLKRELDLGTAAPPIFVPDLPTASLPAPPRRRPGLLAAAALAALVLVGAAAGLWFQRETAAPAPAKPALPAAERAAIRSVAILPLKNLSGDPEQEFFSDGTTEAIIANLAKLGGLRVISSNSTSRYKNRSAGLSEVARDLGVDYVVEGSFLRSGEQLMIIVQLVDPKTDGTLWGDTYRGTVADVFSFQQRVAEAVARQTVGELSTADLTRLANVQEVVPEVYETYLRARYFLNKRTPDAVQQALSLLDQALAKAPRYAPGWAAKAECYLYLMADGISVLPAEAALPKAREAALRALELDESLSDAHAALAFTELQSWQWSKVEKEFRRALELNPSNADAYLKYTLFLTAQERHEEAIAAVEKARQLNPLSLHIRITATSNYLWAGRSREAEESARAAIALQPDHWLPHYQLGTILANEGRFQEADTPFEEAVRLGGRNPRALSALACNEARLGRTESARRLVAEIEAASEKGWVPPSTLAAPLFALGETDRGFEWLQKAADARDQSLLLLRLDPAYAEARSDPRFERILAQVGLDRPYPLRTSRSTPRMKR